MENENKSKDFSSSKQEEIFMYLSIFVALIAYRLKLDVLMWVFAIKACIELVGSISMAVREVRKEK